MGLEARVYTSATRLAPTIDLARATTDSYTGEVSTDSSESFVAIQRRLGNAAMIAWLAEEITKALADIPEPVILTKVLYSATHSGDAISASDFPRLLQEIDGVRESYRESPQVEIENFLVSIGDLIAVAREQGNPIVFV